MSFYNDIKAGLNEALDYQAGKETGAKTTQYADIDVKAIREKLGMSQNEFAIKFGLNMRSLQNWEQNRKHPVGASLTLLRVIEQNPEAVMQAVNHTAA